MGQVRLVVCSCASVTPVGLKVDRKAIGVGGLLELRSQLTLTHVLCSLLLYTQPRSATARLVSGAPTLWPANCEQTSGKKRLVPAQLKPAPAPAHVWVVLSEGQLQVSKTPSPPSTRHCSCSNRSATTGSGIIRLMRLLLCRQRLGFESELLKQICADQHKLSCS